MEHYGCLCVIPQHQDTVSALLHFLSLVPSISVPKVIHDMDRQQSLPFSLFHHTYIYNVCTRICIDTHIYMGQTIEKSNLLGPKLNKRTDAKLPSKN